MKKLFLTSGIIACMACPAFADTSAVQNPTFPDTQGGSTTTTLSGQCVVGNLEVYDGSSTLTAQWDPTWHTITLEEDDYDVTTNTTGAGDSSYNAAKNPLYSVQTDPLVYQTKTTLQDGSFEFTDGIAYGSASANVVLGNTIPLGKTVNFDLQANSPTQTYSVTGMPTPGAQARPFTGFWRAANSTQQSDLYIDSTGHLTQAGSTAASGATTDSTWYAQYDCVTPTGLTTTDQGTGQPVAIEPSLTGYTFGGWWTENGESGSWGQQVIPGCIEESQTLYAKWNPVDYTITFDSGSIPSGALQATVFTSSTSGITSLTKHIDDEFTLPAGEGTCVLPGYHFIGWNCPNLATATTTTLSDGTTTGYAPEASVTFTAAQNIDCHALWAPNTIGLTWALNNGTGTVPENDSCSYDSSVTLPANPTRTGYEFKGWDVTSTTPGAQTTSLQ